MDFGLMGMEGQHQQGGSPDQSSKRKFSGSEFLNQEGSVEDDQPRASKLTANGPDLGLLKQMPLLRYASSCVGGPPQSQMLRFSSPTSGVGGGGGGGGKGAAHVHPRNTGYASGSIHGSFTGIQGPFTPAQWIELEHQALIYKYLTANVPVPTTLLFPIRKALISSGFPGFSAHSYGWGSFHLGYSCSNTDPEPGRCRRTDGKKWRCSRDVVPDQKYCERHINRGRHRSRKPVEGQTGHQAISRSTNPKVVPTSSSATSIGSSSNSLVIAAHQLMNLQVSAPSLATDSVVNRLQGSQGFSMMLTSKASPFPIPKQHVPYEEPPRSEFGFVSSESLLNPSPRANLNYQTYNSFSSFNDQHTQDQHQIHHLFDESNRSTIPWPNELKSDWTQLSMSIPMSELSSSSNQEKGVASPLWLSREPDQTQTKLGVRTTLNEADSNWAPISWGKPMGGPLGEVLNNADSSLNPMTDGYDGSPQFGSSPTGVLQKGASISLSNSASGSSPRGESRMAHEGDCLGDDEMLDSAHATSPSIPAP